MRILLRNYRNHFSVGFCQRALICDSAAFDVRAFFATAYIVERCNIKRRNRIHFCSSV